MGHDLKHYGILGMRWGRRRTRVTSMQGRTVVVDGRNVIKNPTKEQIEAGKRGMNVDQYRNRQMNQKIKAKKIETIQREIEEFSVKQNEMHKKLDALREKKLSEIDATPDGKVKKFLKRLLVETEIQTERDNVVSKLENEFIKRDDAKSKEKAKKLKAVQTEIDKLYTERMKEVDKLKFPENMKKALQYDKELSQMILDGYNQVELEYA